MGHLKITKDELTAIGPCDLESRLRLFGRRKSLTVAQALDAGVAIDDILWVAGRLGRKDLIVRFALAAAQHVAHLNPDPRVQSALDAAQAWLDNPGDKTADGAARAARAARDAAGAARDAAGAAARNAAWAAAWAARDAARNAAWAAAWAARDAAWAARDAAWAAAWAARDAAWDAAWAARDAETEAQRDFLREIF